MNKILAAVIAVAFIGVVAADLYFPIVQAIVEAVVIVAMIIIVVLGVLSTGPHQGVAKKTGDGKDSQQ